MVIIEKKTWMPYFDEVVKGIKTFDVRLGNDKIKVGDIILFKEFDPELNEYTGREISKKVSYRVKLKDNKFGDEEAEFWSLEDIQEHGLFIFALKDDGTSKVHHPSHYNVGKFEVIEVIEDWKMYFNDGNVLKYLARAGHKYKDQPNSAELEIQDLEKALWYLKRHIKNRKKELGISDE